MVKHLIMSEHVQPVLDDIEAVEEDKHSHHKACLQKKALEMGDENLRLWIFWVNNIQAFVKLTLSPRRLVHALLSQSTWV